MSRIWAVQKVGCSYLRDIVDGKVTLVDDVVALDLALPPVHVRRVHHRDHLTTPYLKLIRAPRLEVVVYVNLRLIEHNQSKAAESVMGPRMRHQSLRRRTRPSYQTRPPDDDVTRSDQPKPPAVAIVHQNGLSCASGRASVTVE